MISLWVQNAGDEGTVTCRIKVDGKTVREAESTRPYGVCRVRADSLGERTGERRTGGPAARAS